MLDDLGIAELLLLFLTSVGVALLLLYWVIRSAVAAGIWDADHRRAAARKR